MSTVVEQLIVVAAVVPLTRREMRELARKGGPDAAVSLSSLGDDDDAVVIAEIEPDASDTAEATSVVDDAVVETVEIDDEVFATAVIDEEAASSIIDEFEVAAKLFAFTGQTPVQVAAAAVTDDAAPVAEVRPRRFFRGASFKRVATASVSVGAIGIVSLLAVGMTTPAEALAAGSANQAAASVSLASSSTSIDEDEIQAYIAPADAQVSALDRSDYTTASMAQIAADSGISHYSNFFSNNANSDIQWPFAVGVSISYDYGIRSGSLHEGLDFTPGEGAQIQAVADGTVRIATESGGGYGVMIIIDHVIDGELVSTRYGHMQYGSLQVATGDTVKVGQIIGHVGDTGRSFGAHLHFEVLDNGTTAIDPLPWLREHAGG